MRLHIVHVKCNMHVDVHMEDEMDRIFSIEGIGVRRCDPRREARLMRRLRFVDSPQAIRADRAGRIFRPVTHVHSETVMAAL